MTNATTLQQKDFSWEGWHICVEFPEPAENDLTIQKEVKSILTHALQEYLKQC